MSRLRAGFTVIELLVVCAIIIVVTAMVLVNNNKFGGSVTLENFAYDVALSVRQAQVYGIAVQRFGTGCTGAGGGGNTGCFNSGYGMRFALSSPTSYLLFADLEGTGVYDPSYLDSYPYEATQYPNGEIQEEDQIQQGYSITNLCVIAGTSQGGTCTPVNEIDILYVRPEPQAYISVGGNGVIGAQYSMGLCYTHPQQCNYEAHITLTSPRGDTRTVVVDATGQISVATQ